jgi:hypothetical protein
MERFMNLGIIKNQIDFDETLLLEFEKSIEKMLEQRSWNKEQIVSLFFTMLPNFTHKETGKYLDGKM